MTFIVNNAIDPSMLPFNHGIVLVLVTLAIRAHVSLFILCSIAHTEFPVCDINAINVANNVFSNYIEELSDPAIKAVLVQYQDLYIQIFELLQVDVVIRMFVESTMTHYLTYL
jgi:hypothetical protein